jgi:hypothetical protein
MLFRNTLVASIVAVGTMLGAAAPASAGGTTFTLEFGAPGYAYHHGYRHRDRHERVALSPREIRRILRARGFSEIRYVDRRGSVYQARAENRRGRDVLVTVSARTGEVLDVQRIRGRGRG